MEKEKYFSPCAGCLYESPSCSLVGECREKKIAALNEAEKPIVLKPRVIDDTRYYEVLTD